MPKVTFTQTRIVQDQHAGTEREIRFEVGKTYDLSEASAERWINRGVAVPAGDAKAGKSKGKGKADEGDGAKAGEAQIGDGEAGEANADKTAARRAAMI